MFLIEMNPDFKNRWPKADFALSNGGIGPGFVAGDVCTYCTAHDCENPPRGVVSPVGLSETIESTLPDGVRAMIGNAGCELTFRHRFASNARRNIRYILHWAKSAYSMIGSRLVLTPMDFDLIHDVKTGGKLLAWSAANKVPLAICCGYRFVFKGDEFENIRFYSERYNFKHFGNPYRYPFAEISDAIKASKAEVWTGAGYEGGLAAGVLDKAERFGFAGVFTTKKAWKTHYSDDDDCNNRNKQNE